MSTHSFTRIAKLLFDSEIGKPPQAGFKSGSLRTPNTFVICKLNAPPPQVAELLKVLPGFHCISHSGHLWYIAVFQESLSGAICFENLVNTELTIT